MAYYIPQTTSTQTLSTSAAIVTGITKAVVNTAGITLDGSTYVLPEGTWRIRAQVGIYPNSTAATRLCVSLQDEDDAERIAIGVQGVYGLAANNASKVCTVACECIFVADYDGYYIDLMAWADVTSAKLYKSDANMTHIIFEKIG